MKPRLQASLGQHLVMTPQLRQAIRLLQLSGAELELEIAEAVESNPLLDWEEPAPPEARVDGSAGDRPEGDAGEHPEWEAGDETWYERIGPADDDGESAAEQVAEPDNLQDHLLWQLHLSPLSQRDRMIGVALIEAIGDDGYLRETVDAIAEGLMPGMHVAAEEVLTVLHQLQCFDPVGVGARSLGECLQLQLAPLPADTIGRSLAMTLADGELERLPKVGVAGLAAELKRPVDEVECAVQLLRSLDPRPGRRSVVSPPTPMSFPTAWSGVSTANGGSRLSAALAPADRDPPRLRAHDPLRQRNRFELPARSPAGGALVAQKPGGARRYAAQGDALPAAAAIGIPRIRRPGAAPADPA